MHSVKWMDQTRFTFSYTVFLDSRIQNLKKKNRRSLHVTLVMFTALPITMSPIYLHD